MTATTGTPTKAQQIVRAEIRGSAKTFLAVAVVLASLFLLSEFTSSGFSRTFAMGGIIGYTIILPVTVLRILSVQSKAEAAESESSGTQ